MSACREQVDDTVTACNDAGSRLTTQCRNGANVRFQRCVDYEEESYEDCRESRDEGEARCVEWRECGWDNILACIGGFFCVAEVWVSDIVCTVSVWVTTTVCRTISTIEATICVGLGVATQVACGAVGGLLGIGCRVIESLTYRIEDSLDGNEAESAAKPRAEAMSVAHVADPREFKDSGTHYRFRIADGLVWFRTPTTGWELVAPDGESPKVVSYHRRRAGEVEDAPPFDMVAANSGRVFVKEAGYARFYFTMLEPMFVPRGAGVEVPSMYFKLDPEQGIAEADNQGRLDHLAVPDSMHPAAVRFPIFRHAMGLDLNDTMVVNVDQHLRKWHLIDGRPPMSGGDPPASAGFPPVEAVVTYRSNMPFGGITPKRGYRIENVLDIGVGHAHWHEQRCSIYGGEMDSLDGRGLPPCLTGRNPYRLFNGPVEDQGGFIDNTINYYVLAQLQDGDWRDDDQIPPGAFGILWLDEQAVLSERWRLLDPDDCKFGSFKDVVPSAIVQYLDKDFWHESFTFDRSKFWCPIRAGYVTPNSRMAVSRAVVVISGRDPATRRWELYSINFSFGTADRTWRWRPLPWLDEAIPPGRFGLREDMTLYVDDCRSDGVVYWYQKYLPACAAPQPLDEDLQILGKREGDTAPARNIALIPKPVQGFAHPWQCLPEDVFWFVHTRFSHFGCYESQVSWRWQYYRVKVLDGEEALRCVPETGRWSEAGDQLLINQDAIDWQRLNNILRGGADDAVSAAVVAELLALAGSIPGGIAGAISGEAYEALFGAVAGAADVGPIRATLCQAYNRIRVDNPLIRHQHRKGLFLPAFSLALRFRKPIGWIMTHADKRDDDLLPFDGFRDDDGTPFELQLVSDDRGNTVRVRVERYRTVIDAPRVDAAEVNVETGGSALPRLCVRIRSCAKVDLDVNVWRIKLGCLTRNASGRLDGFDVLFDEIRVDAPIQSNGNGGWHTYEWALGDRSGSEIARLQSVCSESGRMRWGTSLWFEDVVGHVATPDNVTFGGKT